MPRFQTVDRDDGGHEIIEAATGRSRFFAIPIRYSGLCVGDLGLNTSELVSLWEHTHGKAYAAARAEKLIGFLRTNVFDLGSPHAREWGKLLATIAPLHAGQPRKMLASEVRAVFRDARRDLKPLHDALRRRRYRKIEQPALLLDGLEGHVPAGVLSVLRERPRLLKEWCRSVSNSDPDKPMRPSPEELAADYGAALHTGYSPSRFLRIAKSGPAK
jgi:hypothetical protein